MQEVYTKCYYKILISKNGFDISDNKFCQEQSALGQFCFSPNGKKFVKYSWDRGLDIYDFDRCNGNLSNLKNILILPLDLEHTENIDEKVAHE